MLLSVAAARSCSRLALAVGPPVVARSGSRCTQSKRCSNIEQIRGSQLISGGPGWAALNPLFLMADQPLLTPYHSKNLTLRNRVVMAPMTRSRADNPGHVPNDLMV